MRFLYLFAFVVLLAAAAAVPVFWMLKPEKVDLSLFSVDTSSLFSNDRRTRAVTVKSKEGFVMYKKIYETSEPVPEYYPEDFNAMMSFLGEKVLQCDRPSSREDIKLLKDYKIDASGLNDCFVIYLAEEAAAYYSGAEHYRLIKFKTASDLVQQYGLYDLHRAFMSKAYMQNNVWGVQAAALSYFGKGMDVVSPVEKVWLMTLMTVGMMPEEAGEKFDARADMISEEMAGQKRQGFSEKYEGTAYRHDKDIFEYPQLTRIILDEIEARNVDFGKDITVVSGLSIRSVEAAQAAIKERLPFAPAGANMVLAVINMTDGAVEAVASNNKFDYRINRMRRQIGSTFKPIVYLTAFSRGFLPTQLVVDKKYQYKNYGQPYSPGNFEDYYMGTIPLRKGLVFSLNNATIRVARLAGLGNVAETAKKLGMDSDIKPYLAMPLGIFPIRVLNLAEVYSVVGNYGIKKDVGFIMRAEDRFKSPVYVDRKPDERIVPAAAAFQVLNIMQDVPRIGTARGSGLLPGTAAKTGTTDDYKDAWTVAVFPPYAAVAWVGFDDNRSMGEKGTGGGLAAPLIASFQKRILPGVEKIDFKVPEGVVLKNVDYYRGMLTGEGCPGVRTYTEAFSAASLPAECAVSYAEKPEPEPVKQVQ